MTTLVGSAGTSFDGLRTGIIVSCRATSLLSILATIVAVTATISTSGETTISVRLRQIDLQLLPGEIDFHRPQSPRCRLAIVVLPSASVTSGLRVGERRSVARR